MTEPGRLKKSESLEIRIPYPTKEAFMARCRADGRSASEALRAFIDQQLEAPAKPRSPRKGLRLVVGAAIAAAVGAAALPSLARPSLSHAQFDRIDADHDGVLSRAEYAAR
ncbi:MAG: hypothetical protein Q7T23_02995 [Phenylobacterium sp.]|uniref:EF-hand domain-containing protein n=1 Tax=Phenylobacterium ferrooxidans TaxID=2982689 RepID=A0ABW6CXZ6_9CAUL|nr:hypothetical protein [Phenylobacterium sp.]